MLSRLDRPEESDIKLIAGFEVVKQSVLNLHKLADQEDCYLGQSSKYCEIQYLHLVNYLGMLMYLDRKDGKSIEEIAEKYGLEEIKEKLACKFINFDKMLEAYGLIDFDSKGISSLEIDNTFRIGYEVDEVFYNQIDIREALLEEDACFMDPAFINEFNILITPSNVAVLTPEENNIIIP